MTEPTQVLLDGRTISRRLRLRSGQLHSLVRSGRVRLFDGGKYDFEQVREATSAVSSSEQSFDLESTEHEGATAIAVRSMREHAALASTQQNRSFELAMGALEAANRALREENDALRKRATQDHEQIVALQERHVKNLEAHEKVISLAHERELQTRHFERVQQRRDQGVTMLQQAVPHIVEGIKLTFEQRSLLKDFISAAPPGQLEALAEADFLNEKQKATLKKLLAKFAARPAAPAPSSSAPASETHPSAGDGAPHHGAESAA